MYFSLYYYSTRAPTTYSLLSTLFAPDILNIVLSFWGHDCCWERDVRELCQTECQHLPLQLEHAAQAVARTGNIDLFSLLKNTGRYDIPLAVGTAVKNGHLALALVILFEEEQWDKPIPMENYLAFLRSEKRVKLLER